MQASRDCEGQLADVRRARRQLRPDKLPLWKELGADALQAVRDTPGAQQAMLTTQWSQVCDPLGDYGATVAEQRRIADLAERGDEKFLLETRGRHVVAWAPKDTNAIHRLAVHLLRGRDDEVPKELIFVTPLPYLPGACTTSHYFDLWWSPLLSEQKNIAALVKNVTMLPQPVEYVLPSPRGPRHVRQGLVCFRLARSGPRSAPTLHLPRQPLLHVTAAPTLVVDLPVVDLPLLAAGLAAPEFAALRLREPAKSVTSSELQQRVSVDVVPPTGLTILQMEMLVRGIKRRVIRADALIGSKDLITAEDALVVEFLDPAAMLKAWPLCKEALLLSDAKALVRTEASGDSWTEMLESMCKEGELSIISKIRWKASRFGGRAVAVPSATASAVAASRRRRGKMGRPALPVDFSAEVRLNGEVGVQDKEILSQLLQHTGAQIGLNLRQFSATDQTPAGSWRHLASHDASAPPGRARVYLQSEEEVRRIYAALHGQVLQVGHDAIAITVHNDITDARPLMGNGGRGAT